MLAVQTCERLTRPAGQVSCCWPSLLEPVLLVVALAAWQLGSLAAWQSYYRRTLFPTKAGGARRSRPLEL